MALSTAHTSAKAVDVAKLLLLNKCQLTPILPCAVWWCPRLTVTLTLTDSVANALPFRQIL